MVLARISAADEQDARRSSEKAATLFSQAYDILEEIGARYERAELLVTMARCGPGSARRKLANLFRAADVYKQLEVTAKYEKTQALINRSDPPTTAAVSNRSETPSEEPVIITGNPQMERIIRLVGQAAKSELPILLIGETGTGKDLLAKYFHTKTGRSGAFVPVNCAAFPDTLLEAELFGYRKGAFTGATADKDGLLHRADGGTFFLDEIGEMSLSSQAKLLTVLETCKARRVGGMIEEKLDIRFIAATNSDLTDMVSKGTFRRDLYYRLSGICFEIPSLAERPGDIPLLLHHFLKKEGVIEDEEQVDPSLISEFSARSWNGNVRQLESEVRKLTLFSAMAREDSLGDLASVLTPNDVDNQTVSLVNQVEQFEKGLIIKALRQSKGNKSQAARSLAIHESTLRAKMKRYDLNEVSAS
jgi:transcriptional regulator with PAS, ATPase and Fis domain